MTSSEFERFLAERAAAAETSGNASSEGNAHPQQRHKKEDDTSLFAL